MTKKPVETSGSRRQLLKYGFGISGAVLAGGPLVGKALAACGITPEQTEGPFYPVDRHLDSDTDLTQVKGRSRKALGAPLYIKGQVTDENCKPVEGAVVEIWQACAAGKYDHPGDRNNPAPLDPNFQYYGTALTGADGKYLFKTVRPGAYAADSTWMRPSHIHYKVHKLGFVELTTQMYFSDDRYNRQDKILQQLSRQEQELVIVKLQAPSPGMDPAAKQGEFNIAIQRV